MQSNERPLHRWKLVISDLDGTLLDENGLIPDDNKAAVLFLKKLDIGFTIATGRIDRMTRPIVRHLEITLPVIACNGAIIRDCRTDEILARDNIPPMMAMALIHETKHLELDCLCYTADRIYYPAGSRRIAAMRHYNEMHAEEPGDRIELIPMENHAEELTRAGLIKMLVYMPDAESYKKAHEILKKYPGLESVRSRYDLLEIMAAGTSKGKALGKLAEILGIESSQVVAFGDNENDRDMLDQAGLGVAMANASPGAREASSLVTDSNSNAGIAEAIYHLFGKPS